ncbi:MAG: nickel pincer cofactor biosynthesis protein LarC [Actinomycetota bacterium]|nr:nickel pincer cofactor biosynthesis protein LarC [Actinomycetota bacterium]
MSVAVAGLVAEQERTVAWFHCFAGIAGDMALGSLVDAGADLDEIRAIVARLPVPGWTVTAEETMRGGLTATRIVVAVEPSTVTRTYAHIDALLDEAVLPERVRHRASATFAAIAAVEARLHRRTLEQVHFHELGSVDAIVDIVGVAAALEVLGVDAVTASPVATGLGMVRSRHGLLPNPAPAVVELLAGAPTRGLDIPVELTTPTGAGLLAALAESWGPMPAMTLTSSGFGAGTADLDDLPNLTQVVLGVAPAPAPAGRPVVVLETNVDDVTGETLAHALAVLLEAGALDAWVSPIVMKKGRPAHLVSALVDPLDSRRLAEVLARETGTFGVRATSTERWPSPRAVEEVEVAGFTLRVKVMDGPGGRAKVEHDDAVIAARGLALPVFEVVSRAEEAWRSRRR